MTNNQHYNRPFALWIALLLSICVLPLGHAGFFGLVLPLAPMFLFHGPFGMAVLVIGFAALAVSILPRNLAIHCVLASIGGIFPLVGWFLFVEHVGLTLDRLPLLMPFALPNAVLSAIWLARLIGLALADRRLRRDSALPHEEVP